MNLQQLSGETTDDDNMKSLRLQPLNHYSDFGATSESEASAISIVFPYFPKVKDKKVTQSAEGHVRKKTGARAMRRYENEAYLSTLVMITEADGEYEADAYWPDKANQDTGFKCLFEDNTVRLLWDTFISLSETKQIALLSSLAYHDDDEDEDTDEDFDFGDMDPPKRRHGKNMNNSRRQHRRHHRRNKKAPVHFEELPNDAEAFETLRSFEQSLLTNKETHNDEATEYISDSDEAAPPSGSISPKLKAFIRKSALQLQRPEAYRQKKHTSFTLQDLCLMQRVEVELKQAFASDPSSSTLSPTKKPVTWTPSTSLLNPIGKEIQPSKAQPLVLNGFQRMLVHSGATYLGLFSYSSWNDAFNDRQLLVDNRNGTFVVLEQNFLSAIREFMQKQKIPSN